MWPLTGRSREFGIAVTIVSPNSVWGTPTESKALSAFKKYGVAMRHGGEFLRDDGPLFLDSWLVIVHQNMEQKANLYNDISSLFGGSCYVYDSERGAYAYSREREGWESWTDKSWCPTCNAIRRFRNIAFGGDLSQCKNCGERVLSKELEPVPSSDFNTANEVKRYVALCKKRQRSAEK